MGIVTTQGMAMGIVTTQGMAMGIVTTQWGRGGVELAQHVLQLPGLLGNRGLRCIPGAATDLPTQCHCCAICWRGRARHLLGVFFLWWGGRGAAERRRRTATEASRRIDTTCSPASASTSSTQPSIRFKQSPARKPSARLSFY